MKIILTDRVGSRIKEYVSNFIPDVGDKIDFFYGFKVSYRVWHESFVILVCE